MPIGVCAYTFTYRGGFLGNNPEAYNAYTLMDLAVQYGLQGVEFPPEQFLPNLQHDTLETARRYAEEKGLFLVADGGQVEAMMLKRLIPAARALGSRTLRVILSGILGGDRRPMAGRWKEHVQYCFDRLNEAKPIAEEYGITIAIENHSDSTSDDLFELCERLDSDTVGVNLDVGNTLAVCEHPVDYARRLLPFLKNVHLKDYRLYPSSEGYRMARSAIGAGVVDFPTLLPLFDAHHPTLTKTIELGALEARHVRMLEDDYWSEYPPRLMTAVLPLLRLYARNVRPRDEDWRTPFERGEPAEVLSTYELLELEESVAYLKRLGAV
ncbi:MAG: sugar phosphate isomerase/epimerase [Candidatus Latescibacteria bacterium]|nr:sugar phosphate isomerase/epimerase [Candidatus Latescibacterota bacterium]